MDYKILGRSRLGTLFLYYNTQNHVYAFVENDTCIMQKHVLF